MEYSLRALPLGGFVAFPDDEPESKYDPEDPDLLRNRPVKDRIIVVTAGVIANMLLALALCTTQVGQGGEGGFTWEGFAGKLGRSSVVKLWRKSGGRTGEAVVLLSAMDSSGLHPHCLVTSLHAVVLIVASLVVLHRRRPTPWA